VSVQQISGGAKGFLAMLWILGLAALLLGIHYLDAPSVVRLKQLDAKRVEETRRIGDIAVTIRGKDGAWPANLEEFAKKSYVAGQAKTRDPETGQTYEYRVAEHDHLEVCAVFALASDEMPGGFVPFRTAHPAGRYCFSFEAAPNAH
jgi:hypothetical protein